MLTTEKFLGCCRLETGGKKFSWNIESGKTLTDRFLLLLSGLIIGWVSAVSDVIVLVSLALCLLFMAIFDCQDLKRMLVENGHRVTQDAMETCNDSKIGIQWDASAIITNSLFAYIFQLLPSFWLFFFLSSLASLQSLSVWSEALML